MAKRLYSTASFFADKLISFSENELQGDGGNAAFEDDMYMLAEAFYLSGQHRRVVHLLRTRNLIPKQARFRLLAAQSMEQCKEWAECLSTLGDETEFNSLLTNLSLQDEAGMKMAAALCYLRGHVYDLLENRQQAVKWYREALRQDPHCYEAFEKLVDGQMLSQEQEVQLLELIRFGPEEQWIKLLYSSKLNKYDQRPAQSTALSVLAQNFKLENNLDVQSSAAERHYYKHEYLQCYQISKRVLSQDPFHQTVLPVHLASLVALKMKTELFYCAHQLVDAYPQSAVAWFAVGCYYLTIRKLDPSRRFFRKATSLAPHFAPAWIGYGHGFALQDESDQAMSAYRSAARLFTGSHLPSLCIGMEYLRTNNLALAQQALAHALSICAADPAVYHELAVVAHKQKEYRKAIELFKKGLSLCLRPLPVAWESTVFNLGHSYRKLGMFVEAVECYERALSLQPRSASSYSALGFTYHLMGELDKAVDNYHKALALRRDDIFTSEMLQKALNELFNGSDLDSILKK
eukprot:GILJ01012796.1.p1 GENE.GILJ01012796.1~~GILJ01012796.1.p1  ORF type:complete len:526 (+),score=88.80 GILJ01012796.1:22-1578(+)